MPDFTTCKPAEMRGRDSEFTTEWFRHRSNIRIAFSPTSA